MQSWSKNSIVYKPVTSLLYTTALHNNITPGSRSTGEANHYFSPIQIP